MSVTIWDYADVPKRTWEWRDPDEARNHFMVTVRPHGLDYHGDLRVGPYAGPYGGPYQTFEEFFRNGPQWSMPETDAESLREHLRRHRRDGGCRLQIRIVVPADVRAAHLQLNLDDSTFFGRKSPTDSIDVCCFDSDCSLGAHTLRVFMYAHAIDEQPFDRRFALTLEPGPRAITITLKRDGSTIAAIIDEPP